jgi:hypothetical protein
VTASHDPAAQDTMPELIMNNVTALERLVATQHNLGMWHATGVRLIEVFFSIFFSFFFEFNFLSCSSASLI